MGASMSVFAELFHRKRAQLAAYEKEEAVRKVQRETEERFRALVEASSEVLYRMSPDWSEMRVLRSQHFLADTEAPSRWWLEKYIPLEDQPLVLETIQKAIETKSAFKLEHRVRRRDGTVGWTFSRAIPVLNAEGGIIEWFGAASDITSRKMAEEALIRNEKLAATGRLAASIAHEVNNPLAGAMNALYLASSDPGIRPETHKFLQMADQELRRATHITRQTLGFYREGVSREPVALPKLIDEVVGVYASKLQHRKITVHRKYKYGSCTSGNDCFLVNAGELRQMISNLLANGIDALNDNGTLHVRASRTGNGSSQHIHLTIADNGCGIRVGNLKRIFEPFFTTKEAVGTGLGLWITQELVRKHNGSIKVRSREGKGTVFRVTLPADV
jgi:signal transduction histidine kinase